MSRIEEVHRTVETAAQRRAHLTTRALLDGVIRAAVHVARVSFFLRRKLDPKGGAQEDRGAEEIFISARFR